MASSQALNFSNWITTRLDHKWEITIKLFYNVNNDILPDCLSKIIFRKREGSYSSKDVLALIPRYNSRFMRDCRAELN